MAGKAKRSYGTHVRDVFARPVIAALHAAGFDDLIAFRGRVEFGRMPGDPVDEEREATVLLKKATALGSVLGRFEADADRLLQARDALEAAGYGTCIGYLTNTPLLHVLAPLDVESVP